MNQSARSRSAGRPALLLFVIFLTALGVRTCGVIIAPAVPIADAADYHRIAVGLAEGQGYVNTAGQKTAWRPPAYPLFLAGIYRVAGPRVNAAVIVQVVIGALTVLALVLLGVLVIGWREALIAGFVAAFYPGLVWLPRLLLSENLSLLLLLATLSAAALYMKTRRVWWLGIVGFVGGLNTLVRGGNLIVLVVLCAALLFVAIRRRSQPRQMVLGLLLAVAAFAAVLTPWTVRNYRVFHSFVPVATQEGLTLYASYWPPQKNGRFIWGTLPGTEDPEIAVASQLGDEVSASRYLQSVTLQRLRDDPGYFFRLIPSKMVSLLVPLDWEIFPQATRETRSINSGYVVVSLLALLGIWLMKGSANPYKWLLWLLPLVVLMQAIVFYGSPRFRLPAELIAILLAGVGLSRAYAFLKSRKSLLGLKLNLLG